MLDKVVWRLMLKSQNDICLPATCSAHFTFVMCVIASEQIEGISDFTDENSLSNKIQETSPIIMFSW